MLASLTGRIDPPPVIAEWGALVPWPGPHGAAVIGMRRDGFDDAEVVAAGLRTRTPVVVVGGGNPRGAADLHRAGVRQILPRDCSPRDLLGALLAVSGRPAAPTATCPGSPGAPTRRELEVMTLLAKGLSNRDIADQLIISEHTVRNHLGHIFGKLSVSSRTQAVVKAGEVGWLRLPG